MYQKMHFPILQQLQHPFKIIELVSAEKAKKIKGIQDGFHWIKGNHKEVNALFSTSSIAGSLQPEQAVIVTNQQKMHNSFQKNKHALITSRHLLRCQYIRCRRCIFSGMHRWIFKRERHLKTRTYDVFVCLKK